MHLNRRVLLQGTAALAATSALPAFGAATGLDAQFAALVDELVVEGPENATSLGLDKAKHADLAGKLADRSWAGVQQSHVMCTDWIKRLAAATPASPAQALDRDVVTYALELGRDAAAFDFGDNTLSTAMGESSTPYVVSQQSGNFVSVPEFLDSQHRVDDKDGADAYLARVEAFTTTLEQETGRVRRDTAQRVIAPDFLLKTATRQMENFLKLPVNQQRLVTSLAKRAAAKGIAGDYTGAVTQLVLKKVYPAVQRQLDALHAALANANSDAGVWKLRDGEAYYAWALKVGTTTPQTAAEIHKTGVDQLAEITARMDALLRKQGLTQGTVGDRMMALAQDARFMFPETDAGRAQVIDYLNSLIARARASMPKLSRLTLKAPVTVKRVPPDIQDGSGLGYMNSGSLDGSRPSTYYINLKSTSLWPKFSLPTLTHHETIPGHAWQGAYLTETGKLPMIRIMINGFNAYVEGWALYAEQLADEIGLYADDPFGQFGYLQAQQFRAIRLVVDTGIHAMRWTREQAIQYAVQQGGRPRPAMESEIDRYCGGPGQACGYKVGHNELLRLRDKAKAALGARYDLRDYNDWVVEAGGAPLTVLAAIIDKRVAGKA